MEIRRTTKFLALYAAVMAGSRLLLHPPNMTAVGALFLWSGKETSWKEKIVPFVVLFITDIVIGLYDWRLMVMVYLSFGCVQIFGLFLKNKTGPEYILLASIAGSILFFLITNAAVWAFSPWYEKTLQGLMESYAMGLPFLRNMLAGDSVYATLFFGVYALKRKAALVQIRQKATI